MCGVRHVFADGGMSNVGVLVMPNRKRDLERSLLHVVLGLPKMASSAANAALDTWGRGQQGNDKQEKAKPTASSLRQRFAAESHVLQATPTLKRYLTV